MDGVNKYEDDEASSSSPPIVTSLWEVPNSVQLNADGAVQVVILSGHGDRENMEHVPISICTACRNGKTCSIFSFPFNPTDSANLRNIPPLPHQCRIHFDCHVEAISLVVKSNPVRNRRQYAILLVCTRDGKLWRSKPEMDWSDSDDKKRWQNASDCMLECQSNRPLTLLGTKRLTPCVDHKGVATCDETGAWIVATGTMLGPPQMVFIPDVSEEEMLSQSSSKINVQTLDMPGIDHVNALVSCVCLLSCRLLADFVWDACRQPCNRDTAKIVLFGFSDGTMLWSCLDSQELEESVVTCAKRVYCREPLVQQSILSVMPISRPSHASSVKSVAADIVVIASGGTSAILSGVGNDLVLQNFTTALPPMERWSSAAPFVFGQAHGAQHTDYLLPIFWDTSLCSSKKHFDRGIVATTSSEGSTYMLALSCSDSKSKTGGLTHEYHVESNVAKLPIRRDMALITTSSLNGLDSSLLLTFATKESSVLCMSVDQTCWDSLWLTFGGSCSSLEVLRLAAEASREERVDGVSSGNSSGRTKQLLNHLDRFEKAPASVSTASLIAMRNATDEVLDAIASSTEKTTYDTSMKQGPPHDTTCNHSGGSTICHRPRNEMEKSTLPVRYGGTAVTVAFGDDTPGTINEIGGLNPRNGAGTTTQFKSLSLDFSSTSLRRQNASTPSKPSWLDSVQVPHCQRFSSYESKNVVVLVEKKPANKAI